MSVAVHSDGASTATTRATPLTGRRRAAVLGGVVGNYVDQLHIFLPVVALGPALPRLAGPSAAVTAGAVVVVATLLGRPIGAMLFGRIADRVGRTSTTQVAIAGTAACTALIALMPTHHVLGAATIWLIVALRFLAGVFLAGEYSAAIPLAMEWSKPLRRGLFSGLIMAMAPWAQATIAFATLGGIVALGGDAYATWGWRVLFALGALASLVILAFYRRRVRDAAATDGRGGSRARLLPLLVGEHRGAFWQMFGLMSGMWLMTNMVVLYLTARLQATPAFAGRGVSIAMGLAAVAQALVMSVTGDVSTRTGRRAFFVGWGLLAAVAGPLLWRWTLAQPTLTSVALGAMALQVLTVCCYGPVGAYLSERLPVEIRSTGYGTAYSLSIVIPALYPFWLPALRRLVPGEGAPMLLLVLGGLLVAGCGALGPALRRSELDASVETVSARQRHG